MLGNSTVVACVNKWEDPVCQLTQRDLCLDRDTLVNLSDIYTIKAEHYGRPTKPPQSHNANGMVTSCLDAQRNLQSLQETDGRPICNQEEIKKKLICMFPVTDFTVKACPDDRACPTGKHCSHNPFQYTRWEGEWRARTEVRSQNDTIIW